jgi:murein DD-endopeptidase MepM/ murein hydrolase activator NlpD
MLFSLVACGTFPSGKYVQIKKGDNIEKIAKIHNVKAWQIQEANQGKRIAHGEWIFIPQKRGIISHLREQTVELERQVYITSGKFLWPVPSNKTISSKFGHRWGRPHEGIDIPAREGSYFLSSADGVVVYSGNDLSGYGNLLVLGHKDGVFTVYAHAQKLFVHKGEKVFKGQAIGKVGQTGKATGPHLHFEMRKMSRALDPTHHLVFN